MLLPYSEASSVISKRKRLTSHLFIFHMIPFVLVHCIYWLHTLRRY